MLFLPLKVYYGTKKYLILITTLKKANTLQYCVFHGFQMPKNMPSREEKTTTLRHRDLFILKIILIETQIKLYIFMQYYVMFYYTYTFKLCSVHTDILIYTQNLICYRYVYIYTYYIHIYIYIHLSIYIYIYIS